MVESQYLQFDVHDRPDRATKLVVVRSKRSGLQLGTLSWYAPWRQYCFWPEEGTIFNRGCLETINAFITGLMDARKQEKGDDHRDGSPVSGAAHE